ncbi:MAG: hypothetical protein FH759_00445 [Sediminimonas qiaohouensis]|uniref:Glycosyl transferase family 2 n=1 Tax=Sediminimonas qiaohouensis TaxID=552061 RepID=A0A7C9HA27_9RHOB|nr:glycosyltransferase family 2 protein [Sediminimonas qiaohouensis]MTJ03145.1 hypothetical protein [Sediminimonas qiaohouensis]
MKHDSLRQFLANPGTALSKGPIAMIFVEDACEIESTLRHHLDRGFAHLLVFIPDAFDFDATLAARDDVHRIALDTIADNAVTDTVNRVIAAAPGLWMYYCFNAEYLFYPFCESRTIGEMLTFHTEEKRDAMMTYVIDLYAGDLDRYPDAVAVDDAHIDRSGYYALGRPDPQTGAHLPNQLDFYGGLRWRYEEHVPTSRRRIDRIALFRAREGLRLQPGHTFNDAEYNTYSCPWHHNLTAAICSFRTAKALKRNPGSTFDIHTFRWHNSTPFEWHSSQLLDLGLMEPGQWF